MRMSLRVGLLVVALAACAAVPAPAFAATLLRLDGIGPLKLGMSRVDAVRTGWLSDRAPGCPMDLPVPTTYRLEGAAAPRALAGMVQFQHGKLNNITVTRAARTAVGVTVGRTSPSGMVRLYRRAGFTATAHYESVFQATFVDVERRGRAVIGGFATGRAIRSLSIPRVLACE